VQFELSAAFVSRDGREWRRWFFCAMPDENQLPLTAFLLRDFD